jgi:endonuclease/exonuclease/phosphatase family metal-dependent hydrolase
MKLKILSWNIWCGTHLAEVINFLRTADADIIALQESAEDERGNISKIIAEDLGYQYIYTTDVDMPLKYLPGNKVDDERTIKMGNAILSKYEIVNHKEHKLIENKNRTVLEANIKIENIILNVFSIHLRHTHQKQLDLQDLQVENLLKLLPDKNTIVMGDFNSLPDSSVIKKVNNLLQNTEIDSNTSTWSVYKEGCTECQIGDVVHKLDYIFTTRELVTNSFEVHNSKASDHLPISVIIKI